MSERLIRERIAEVVSAAAATANVHDDALRIDSESTAVAAFGEGKDDSGLYLLHGWVVMPGKSSSERLSRGMAKADYEFSILGYRSRVEGADIVLEAEIADVEAALMELDALVTLSPRPVLLSIDSNVNPASMAGFPVFEADVTVSLTAYTEV
jgi:hypothetical protein